MNYKIRQLSNLFILNNVNQKEQSVADQHHCVYQYICNRDGCKTNNLYSNSNLYSIQFKFILDSTLKTLVQLNHLKFVHSIDKVATADLIIPNVSIVKYSSDLLGMHSYDLILSFISYRIFILLLMYYSILAKCR